MWNRLYWYLMHRYCPKYQYNVVRMPSLEPGYYDPDVRMLHACFDMFAEWFHYNVFEAKLMDHHCIDEGAPGTYDEMMELYKWWTVSKPEFELREDVSYVDQMNFEKTEQEMLLRLITIRRHIWYL